MALITHWTSKDLEVLPQIEGVRYEIIDGELHVSTPPCWTSKDLERFPADLGLRYEIIDGELHVSTAPSFAHQYACAGLVEALRVWSRATGLGVALSAPGLIFTPDRDVIPDVIWISHARLQGALNEAGHLTHAPELVVEVTSPGPTNAWRDRDVKRDLYSRQGVQEYWIVDPLARTVDVYRPVEGQLVQVEGLGAADTLTSALLPGFSGPVHTLFRMP
jgi:Uma2 family endonuclease